MTPSKNNSPVNDRTPFEIKKPQALYNFNGKESPRINHKVFHGHHSKRPARSKSSASSDDDSVNFRLTKYTNLLQIEE